MSDEKLGFEEEVFKVSLYPIAPYLLSKNFEEIADDSFVKFDSEIKASHKIVIKDSTFDPNVLMSDNITICESLVVHFVISEPKQHFDSIIDTVLWLCNNFANNTFQFILEFMNDVDVELIKTLSQMRSDMCSSYLGRDATANLGIDLNLTSRLAVIVPNEFRTSAQYPMINEKFDIFLNIKNFDDSLIDECFEDNNLYFSGSEQQAIFAYLQEQELLDDFTLFENYKFEIDKESESCRIYEPNQFIFE